MSQAIIQNGTCRLTSNGYEYILEIGSFTVGIFQSFFIPFFSCSYDSHYFSLLFSFILSFSLPPLMRMKEKSKEK